MANPESTPRWTVPFALAAVLALVAGCEPPETEDPFVDEAVEEPAEAPPGTVPLEPVGESGVFGEANATRSANEILVVLTVSGLEEDGEFPAHIHEGTCAEGGPVAVGLNPVIATAGDGSGTSTTALELDDFDHESPHFFQVHARDGPPIACGDAEIADEG